MKNYLVIGGSSGIGRALAKKLASEGHSVTATYNNTQRENENGISYHQMDVLGESDLSFIPDVLDGLAYCPGSINLLPFARIKPADYLKDFDLQVVGAIKVIQHALAALKQGEHPSIVLFSTAAVQTGFNFHTQVSASKGAIEGLTRSLAAELSPKIRVNAIAPSITDTPLAERLLNTDQKREANAQRHPLGRVGEAEDIANTASFLLSDQSSWMTGQILHVDGGVSNIRK